MMVVNPFTVDDLVSHTTTLALDGFIGWIHCIRLRAWD
jgi:hypothetical protein